ncbi:transglycosylase SLT domain-containing protein [Streptomyces sp. NPDC058440]|uniref:transglycosylase SLT domain-containing protein n=1 Tax=Streptomyces sp. NPDC058440 TaxID=3346501 RepID=UPI00366822D4
MSNAGRIKVGSAFIQITPEMDHAALQRELSRAQAQVAKFAEQGKDITQQYARLQVKLIEWVSQRYGAEAAKRVEIDTKAAQARKQLANGEMAYLIKSIAEVEKADLASERRKEAAKRAATRRRERIALNARDLEVKFGQDVADAYKAQMAKMEADKKRLTLVQINEAKRWAELEQAEIRRVAAVQREADQQAIRGAQIRATETAKAAKTAQVAYVQAFEAERVKQLQAMELDQMRTKARIAGEISVREAALATSAAQLTQARATLAQVAGTTALHTTSMVKSWHKVGSTIERTGTSTTELGRSIMHNVVTPMAAAGAALTAWGLKAADNFQNTQVSLKNMGMALKDANDLMNNLTEYGLKTPYSVNDMVMYGTRFARAAGAHDADFVSSDPKRHAAGSKRVSQEAQNIVQMIGDLAARGGITDSAMVARGYYAMEKLMDADRVSLRDTKQLEYAINMPVQELASLLGFRDKQYTQKQVDKFKKVNPGFHGKAGDTYAASAQMMEVMANAKITGGVRGRDMVESLLGYWSGEKALPGGKPDKTLKGAAEMLGTATFGSRVSNMKEGAQQTLRTMFQSPNKKGELEYTGLGAALMGKKVTDNQKYIETGGRDKFGQPIYKKNPNYGKAHWEGGVLNDVSDIGSDLMGKNGKGPVPQLMKGFVEGVSSFVKTIKKIADFLNEHPEVFQWVKEFGKLAAKVAPFLIAFGLATKALGMFTKLLSPLGFLFKGLGKGLKGATKVASQITGIRSKTDAQREARDIRNRAKEQARQDLKSDRRAARRMADPADRYQARRDAAEKAKQTRADAKDRAKDVRRQGRVDTNIADRYRERRAGLNGGDDRSVARRAVDRVTGNNSQQERLTLNISQYQEEMKKAKGEIADLKRKISELNRQSLNHLAKEAAGKSGSVQDAAKRAEHATGKAKKAAEDLNKVKLKVLKGQYNNATSAAGSATKATTSTRDSVKKLNGQTLATVKGQFIHVKDAAHNAYKKAGSLKDEVKNVNGKKLSTVTTAVDHLKTALKNAKDEASKLNSHLTNISRHTPGGGSKGPTKPKKKKKALGGVLNGYTPGRDVHTFVSPTAGTLELSGGESVMRPEWTRAVGPDYVNKMNHLARTGGVSGVRRSMKFAKGGILGKLGLDQLMDLASYNIAPDALAVTGAMKLYNRSDALGGDTRKGIMGSGKTGNRFIGSDLADKFHGLYDWMTKDIYKFLKKAPIPDGWSQIIGILGGTLAPISGQYFWDDVWKGQGNILERGGRYLNDLFSWKTLKGAVSNLFGGAWDSLKSLWSGGKALLTDPVGFISDGVSGLWELTKGQYDNFVDTIKTLREIWNNPLGYAEQVVSEIYDTAKESLPNLDQIFDFSGSGLHSSPPDMKKLIEGEISTPGVGDAVKRWTPQVKMVLAQLGLPESDLALVLHRIAVESGGNPKAINLTDSNAKAGYPSQGLMQTIPQTFAAYAGPYKSRGITDGLASIYAGLNYATHRYGANWRKALSGNKGYAKGTTGADRGWAWVGEEGPELVNFNGGETVLTHQDSMLAAVKVLKGYASGTGSSKRTSGIAADAEKGISTLNTAVKKLYEIITKAFTSDRIGSGTANNLNKWLDKQNKQLQALVKQRTDLAPKLKDANKKLEQIKKDESSMAESISDKARGMKSIADVFNSDGVSTSSALSGLKERLAAIKTFQADLTALSKKGFSQEIIAEVAQAGVEQGDAMAKELLNSSAAQVKDFNKTYAAIDTASDSLGKSVAKNYYAAGKKAAQSLVDGLTAKDNKLKKQIEGIADTIVKTLKKKLKFNSKTPVDASLGTLLTWLTGESQAVKGKPKPTPKKKTTRVTTSYSTDSKGRKVVTVTTTVTDPATGTTTTTTERTVNGKTTVTTKVSKIKGYATGTRSASPGIALVGERGPEIVNFGGGERVHNAKDTASMLGPRYEIHVHEAKAENTTQSVLRAMKYAEVMAGM